MVCEGTTHDSGARLGGPLALSDPHALVANLQANILAQEAKIAVLQGEISEIWQEIHRVSNSFNLFFKVSCPPSVERPMYNCLPKYSF
jgi:hypothetical protein